MQVITIPTVLPPVNIHMANQIGSLNPFTLPMCQDAPSTVADMAARRRKRYSRQRR